MPPPLPSLLRGYLRVPPGTAGHRRPYPVPSGPRARLRPFRPRPARGGQREGKRGGPSRLHAPQPAGQPCVKVITPSPLCWRCCHGAPRPGAAVARSPNRPGVSDDDDPRLRQARGQQSLRGPIGGLWWCSKTWQGLGRLCTHTLFREPCAPIGRDGPTRGTSPLDEINPKCMTRSSCPGQATEEGQGEETWFRGR